MQNYDWYYLFNLAEFIADNLSSRELTFTFPTLGLVTILITNGNLYSIVFNDVMLPIGLNNLNPFYFGGYAVYYDAAQGVWLGIQNNGS